MLGIDVSEHQGKICWNRVKGKVDFAILRIGYGSNYPNQDDIRFRFNADECTRLGIPFGVYIYSYAKTIQEVHSEAEHVLRVISGYHLSLPVFYDLEDDSQKNLGTTVLCNFAEEFCERIKAGGYMAGIYANLYWWTTRLTSQKLDKYEKWVAQYMMGSVSDYSKPHSLWQYSSMGSVDGIWGPVDMNRCYKNYMEVEEMKTSIEGIVVYRNDAEADLALKLARKLGYAAIWSGTPCDYSAINPDNIWALGGDIGSYTSYLKPDHFVSGKDRVETLKKVADLISSIK